tara:strand:- start:7598 stop:8950 length:1353 start_codon:yes stop_codon:yes gene_type:complete
MIFKNNIIKNKKITILGAGISGIGASNLAIYKDAKVLISNNKKFKKPLQIDKKIDIEYSHTKKCINSDLVVISPGINPNNNNIVNKLKKSNIPIISEIEFASWFTKSPLVAVTGSNGKSTVVKMLYHIFKDKYKNVFLGGNIGISFSNNVHKELKNKLNKSIHILEVSSFQLENILSFKPYISCILNITEDHIDRHGSFNNYTNQKLKIVKNHNPDSFIVYNQDDKNLNGIFKEKLNSLPFSIKNKNKFYINRDTIYCSQTNKKIIDQNQTGLIGIHNLSNILACIEISILFNIEIKNIVKSIKSFKPLKHRMETVYKKDKFIIINDSKGTNLDSMKSAVNSFSNKIILLIGGYSKNKINQKKILEITKSNNIYKIICFGDVGKDVNDLLKVNKKSIYMNDFKKAILKSIEYSSDSKSIIFSPGFKSFDEFKNFEDRGNQFKKIINEYYA